MKQTEYQKGGADEVELASSPQVPRDQHMRGGSQEYQMGGADKVDLAMGATKPPYFQPLPEREYQMGGADKADLAMGNSGFAWSQHTSGKMNEGK